MTVAMPIFQNRISPVFDWSRNLLIVEIQSGREDKRQEVEVAATCPAERAGRLVDLGVTVLVCSAISEQLQSLIEERDIQVIPGVAGKIDDVLSAMISDSLPHPHLRMAGCSEQHGFRGDYGGKGRKHRNRKQQMQGGEY